MSSRKSFISLFLKIHHKSPPPTYTRTFVLLPNAHVPAPNIATEYGLCSPFTKWQGLEQFQVSTVCCIITHNSIHHHVAVNSESKWYILTSTTFPGEQNLKIFRCPFIYSFIYFSSCGNVAFPSEFSNSLLLEQCHTLVPSFLHLQKCVPSDKVFHFSRKNIFIDPQPF